MINSESLHQLCGITKNFVRTLCGGRDASHGFGHAQAVAHHAQYIARELGIIDERQLRIVMLTAWLHDVADHKYDRDGLLKREVDYFLRIHVPEDAALISAIIDRVSYSKEVHAREQGCLDWQEVLGDEGILLRTIVSDADKLEALGKQGLDRCVLYARHVHGAETAPELLAQYVREHAQEKLLRLKDHFIRTEPGKRLAEPLHQELLAVLAAL